jgi:hypothetical protein
MNEQIEIYSLGINRISKYHESSTKSSFSLTLLDQLLSIELMKLRSFLMKLVIISLFIFVNHCASGNIWLYVNEDGSGKIQMIRKDLESRKKVQLDFLRNVRSEESELLIVSADSQFNSIHTLEMEGASFIYYSNKEFSFTRNCLLFTLDTSKNSAWFKYFRINEVSLSIFEKEAKSRDDIARFNNLTDFVVWEIHLPGEVEKVTDFEPIGLDWWISKHSNEKVILKIPARDILNSKRNLSTYETCSVQTK